MMANEVNEAKDVAPDVATYDVTESRLNRIRIGDHVQMLHNDYEPLATDDGVENATGEVKAFGNEIGSYLVIDFGPDGEHTLTEEDVRRVIPVGA
jgi:hypothetical protein